MPAELPVTPARGVIVLTLAAVIALATLAGTVRAQTPPAPSHPAPAVPGGQRGGIPAGQMAMMQHQQGQMPMVGHGGAATLPRGSAASPTAPVDEHDHGSGETPPAKQQAPQ